MARASAIEETRPASGADKHMKRVEWVIGAVLALAAGSLTYRIVCSAVRCSDSGVGLPFLFLAALIGLLAIGFYLKVLQDWRDQWALRLGASGVALLVITATLLLPALRSGQAAMARKTELQSERAVAEDTQRKAEAGWRAGLLARGDHGPPGVVPPQLRSEASGDGVTITNTTQQPIVVSLARVQEDIAAPGGWRACAMHTSGSRAGGMRYYRYSLAPGARATFVNFEPCAASFKSAPIEYRVGEYPGDTGWWSDSALAAPGSREYADGR